MKQRRKNGFNHSEVLHTYFIELTWETLYEDFQSFKQVQSEYEA